MLQVQMAPTGVRIAATVALSNRRLPDGEAAVREVFRVKGRPLTDPLIVHVGCLEDALELVEVGNEVTSLTRLILAIVSPPPPRAHARPNHF